MNILYAVSMELNKPTESSQTDEVAKQKNVNGQKKGRILIFIGLVIILVVISGVYLFLQQPKKNTTQYPKSVKQKVLQKPLSEVQKALLLKIASRAHIKDQKNIGRGDLASGFLAPSALEEKSIRETSWFTEKVYAADVPSVHPFLFYIKDNIKVNGYDLLTKEEYQAMNLENFPEVITNGKTQIYDFSFLNTSKRIAFTLVEQTNNENAPGMDQARYRVSLKVFDITANKLTTAVSVDNIHGGELPNFDNNLKISPDEKMIFWMYDNQSGYNPFPEIPDPFDESGHPVVIFYNVETGELYKTKLLIRISGAGLVREQWLDDSKSIILAFRTIEKGERVLTFLQVLPDGNAYTLLHEKAEIETIEKIQFISSLKKLYFTGSANVVTTDSRLYEYDFLLNQVKPVLASENLHTMNIVYDYQGGLLYDTYGLVKYSSNTGGIQNRALNYYEVAKEESREITPSNLSIIGFNGDYDHVLVNGYIDGIDNKYSNIYDLDIRTGVAELINIAPISWSVFPD